MMYLNANSKNALTLTASCLTVTYDVFKCAARYWVGSWKCSLTVTYDVFK